MSNVNYNHKTLSQRIVLGVFICLTPFLGLAQGEVGLIDFKMRKPETVDLVKTANGDLVYCFLNTREIQLSTVTSNYSNSSAVFQTSKELVRSEYIVSTRDQAFHTLYFFSHKLNSIQAYNIDLSLSTTQTIQSAMIPKEESFLTAVVINNKLYVLTVAKVGSMINLWEFFRGTSLSKTPFDTHKLKFHESLESREEDLNEKKYSSIGIDRIDYALESNLKSAHANNKLYCVGDSIMITIDEPDHTRLYTIDANQKKFSEKNFLFKLEKGENSGDKQGNSFLYNKQLFRTTINNEMMNISVLDIDSVKLQWSYNIFPNQPITIKNGPMITEGQKDKVLPNTAQYFNRILSGRICIAVNEINDQYLVQVGSYEYRNSMNSYNSGGPNISIGMGIGMGGVGMGFPVTGGGYGTGMSGYYNGYPGYYPSDAYSYIETTYFYSLMDSKTLAHSPLAPPKTIKERLNEYEDQKFKKGIPDLIKVFPLENKVILMGYYAKHLHKYQLVEIR